MKVDLKAACAQFLMSANENKPQILTGIGLTLFVAVATPVTVIATLAAHERVEERRKELAEEIRENSENPDILVDPDTVEVPPMEVVKVSWKYFVPVGLTLAAGSFCVIASTKEGLKRTAEALAMYKLSDMEYKKYREKTKEVVGDKKEDEVNTRVMRDRMELMTDEEGHVCNIYDTRDGTTLCYDYLAGRYFYSDIDYIRRQLNEINTSMLETQRKGRNAFATVNDVYNAIGLPSAGIGESLVWRLDSEGLVKARPTSILVDDRPCWVLNFETAPTWIPSWKLDRL